MHLYVVIRQHLSVAYFILGGNMGTSNKFSGPVSTSKVKYTNTQLGLSNGSAFGSFSNANWKGAKKVIRKALNNYEQDFLILTLKSLLKKSGAVDVFLESIHPGLALFVNVALAIYGIETSNNEIFIKLEKEIRKFKEYYNALIWIVDYYTGDLNTSDKEIVALRDSLLFFVDLYKKNLNKNEVDLKKASFEMKKFEISSFISKYIENMINVYLGAAYEDVDINPYKLMKLKYDAFNQLLIIVKANLKDTNISIDYLSHIVRNTIEDILRNEKNL
jgi:hypothetical protein